jgi:hypothetical protein
MSTRKQKLANRQNAKKSCGPSSPAGLEKVSQNATKHALCGRFRVLESESQSEYDDLLQRFMRVEQPADDVERELVAKMVRHTWMSERAVRLQEACFIFHPRSEEDIKSGEENIAVRTDIEVYVRYQAANDRAYQRAANALATRRAERRKVENGFVSQKRAEAQELRREKQQTQRDEVHHFKVAAAQKRLQREEIANLRAMAAAANEMDALSPPQVRHTAA